MAWQFRIDRGDSFTGIVARDPWGMMPTTTPQSGKPDARGDADVAGPCRLAGTR